MKIDEILKNKRTLSFEVFPPKKDDETGLEKLMNTVKSLKSLNPDFISVTYGASGSNSKNTVEIASFIKSQGIEPLAHLTAGPSSYAEIDEIAKKYKELKIENILALRGDKPKDLDIEYCKYFKHASELEEYLKDYGFTFGAACYPEGHPESETLIEDVKSMKIKEEKGAKFFITQLFYDNSYYYRLVKEAKNIGITSPIIPGIMPITNVKNIKKTKQMCGNTIPLEFTNMLEKFSNNPYVMEEVGINYACYQIIDLIANGAPGVHLYIMNNFNTAKKIYERLESLINELF